MGEETIGYSMSGEEAEAVLGTPPVGVHGDGRAVIRDDPRGYAPVLKNARLLARLSRVTGSLLTLSVESSVWLWCRVSRVPSPRNDELTSEITKVRSRTRPVGC